MNQSFSRRSSNERATICSVGLYACSPFSNMTHHRFEGGEVDTSKGSTRLSRLPWYDVSFVVFNDDKPSVEYYNRVNIYAHSGHRPYPLGRHSNVIQRSIRRVGPIPRLKMTVLFAVAVMVATHRKMSGNLKKEECIQIFRLPVDR